MVIESQALFAPYFAAAITRSGHDVVGVERAARAASLRRLRPDVVVVDAAHLRAPLAVIRRLRARLPEAHLVVYSGSAEATWGAVARALGADIVVGPRTGEFELLTAVAG